MARHRLLLALGGALIVSTALTVALTASAQAAGDITAPVLTGISVSPVTVDTNSGPITIDATLQVTDDLSGAHTVYITLLPPISGGVSHSGFATLTSGTTLDGTWQASVTLPQYAAGGQWALQVHLTDVAGNTTTITSSALAADGFPSVVQDTGSSDITAPVLTGFSVSPVSIDTSTGPTAVYATFEVTDDLSGAQAVDLNVVSPVEGGADYIVPATLSSGTALDGTWQASLALPQYSPGGQWALQVGLADAAGNTRTITSSELAADGFPSVIQGTGSSDVAAPVLTGFSVSAVSMDTNSGPVTIDATLQVTDDLSGVQQVYVQLFSPAVEGTPVTGYATLTSGTTLDGTWQASVTLPQYAAGGQWALRVGLTDLAGNTRTITSSALAADGFPSVVQDTDVSPQTIRFTSAVPPHATVDGPPYTASVTSGASGEPVIFTSHTPAVCGVSGSAIYFLGVGTCTIEADQAGGSGYAPAAPDYQSFSVINAPNLCPGSAIWCFTSRNTDTMTVGKSSSFSVTTVGTYGQLPPASTKLKKVGKLPKGVTFRNDESGKGTLSGTPTSTRHKSAAGTYFVTLQATFGKGKTKHIATQVLRLIVAG